MGYRISRYYIDNVPKGEEIEFGDVVLCSDNRSVLHGRIVNCEGNPVPGAIVKVFVASASTPVCLCNQTDNLTDLGHVFTDVCGQFIFPVTEPCGKRYLIKVFATQCPSYVEGTITPCFDTENCCNECNC